MKDKNDYINVENARNLIRECCKDFLKDFYPGVVDFKIDNSEAFLLMMYTNSYFELDESYQCVYNHEFSFGQEPLKIEAKGCEGSYNPIEYQMYNFCSPRYYSYFSKYFDQSETKYLVLLDNRNPQQYEEMLKLLKQNEICRSDCIIWPSRRVYPGKDIEYSGYGESFWEYIAGIVLRKKGYFISKFGHGGDLFAYKIPDYFNKLIKKCLLFQGAFIEELQMLHKKYPSITPIKFNDDSNEIFCIEAEPSYARAFLNTEHGINQVRKYLKKSNKFYTGGYVSAPYSHLNDSAVASTYLGVISCDEEGNLIEQNPKASKDAHEFAGNQVKKYIVTSILRNFNHEQLCELFNRDKIHITQIPQLVDKMSFDELLYAVDKSIKI